ncbi:LacI family DNA-binding transcriptional regulator [Oceaniglobus ichthyenteri]|uniref:LacI family DNA-binding transcriptional regulator n=1 Tax=Oceaniglobus ichthyenteri TaxID=2136177 RepID=UPI000D393318|nr:LacI family DNA-binding transcriptional regulator [Oceaniglobus ichthyenteri]
MKRQSPPTLQDVARAARVSTATISRALNEPAKVAKATRERIDRAIATLGYTPNFGGRVLASNRTNTMGAIIPSLANAMFANGIQAFQEELDAHGITLLIATNGYDPLRELDQIRALMARGADGLLLIGAERPVETHHLLTLRQMPYVLGWCLSDDASQLCAGFDNHAAAQMMAQRVLDMGHRRIAMIAGISAGNDRARARIDGVRAAINAQPDARLTRVVESPYLLDPGAEAFTKVMEGEPPTVIICGNDVLAAGAMVAARARGLSIPDDISITGFDNIGLASVVFPGLTTVHVPQARMGQAAARLLLARVAGAPDLQSVALPTEVVMRGSLAAIAR